MNTEAATRTLGIENNMINQKIIFNSFVNEFTNNKNRNKLIEARNTLLREIVKSQVEDTGRFIIDIKQSEKVCPDCNGTGEMYKVMKEVKVDCKYCNGTGTKTEKCKTCHGTGQKFGKTCFSCKGTGKYFHYKNFKRKVATPCPKCNGEGTFKIKVPAFELNGTTTCSTCNGTGLNMRNLGLNKSKLSNKVITPEMAAKLKIIK